MSAAVAQLTDALDSAEYQGELSILKYLPLLWETDHMEVDSDAGQTNTGSVAATAAASDEAPVEVITDADVTDVTEAEASSEILDAPAEGAAGSVESDLVASAGNDQVEGKVLRLRGGAPPGVLLPARRVAGKRRRSPYKRAAIKLAKFAADQTLAAAAAAAAAAKAAAESPELPAKVPPDSHAHSSNPDSYDSAAEEQAEEEESTQHGASMTAALDAKMEELKAQKAKAVARATKYKQANKELRERAASVTPDSSSGDNAGVDDAFLDTLAQLVSQRAKKASAPMKAAEPRRPKPFNGEGEQDSRWWCTQIC